MVIVVAEQTGFGAAFHAAYTEAAAALAALAEAVSDSFFTRSLISTYVGKTPTAMPTMTHCTADATPRETSEAIS